MILNVSLVSVCLNRFVFRFSNNDAYIVFNIALKRLEFFTSKSNSSFVEDTEYFRVGLTVTASDGLTVSKVGSADSQ